MLEYILSLSQLADITAKRFQNHFILCWVGMLFSWFSPSQIFLYQEHNCSSTWGTLVSTKQFIWQVAQSTLNKMKARYLIPVFRKHSVCTSIDKGCWSVVTNSHHPYHSLQFFKESLEQLADKCVCIYLYCDRRRERVENQYCKNKNKNKKNN